MQDPQLWLVLAAVAAAAVFLWRRQRRVNRGLAPACGNCDHCHCEDKS